MRKIKHLALLILVLLIATACSKESEQLERTGFLMDTIINIKLKGSKDEQLMDDIFKLIENLEKDVSKTIDTSYISRINQEAGKTTIGLSPDIYQLMSLAKEYAKETDGVFDPTIGPLVSLWDIRREDGDRTWLPTVNEIEDAQAKVDYKKIIIEAKEAGLMDKAMELDLGGIAKGYAADKIKDILDKTDIDSALIDLGGNIFAYGDNDAKGWNIGIRNPLGTSTDYLGIVNVSDLSVVTSGAYERYFKVDDRIYHHIIDPATGQPADSDLLSVTTVSKSSTLADAYSTSLFIMGMQEARKVVETRDDMEAILLSKDGRLYISPGLKDSFTLGENLEDFQIVK